jgi:hypothetical protein
MNTCIVIISYTSTMALLADLHSFGGPSKPSRRSCVGNQPAPAGATTPHPKPERRFRSWMGPSRKPGSGQSAGSRPVSHSDRHPVESATSQTFTVTDGSSWPVAGALQRGLRRCIMPVMQRQRWSGLRRARWATVLPVHWDRCRDHGPAAQSLPASRAEMISTAERPLALG